MNKLFDINRDIQLRLFYVLGWTACIANTIGFIANAIFYGFTWMTLVCGGCALIMYIATVWGIVGKQVDAASKLILFVINVFEFPFLLYIYGQGRMAYMFLGLVGLVVFINGKAQYITAILTIILDTFMIIISVVKPCNLIEVSLKDDLGATVITYLVSAISISLIIIIIIIQYQRQNKKMIELTEELKEMALLDPLTKLYNRRFLTEYIEGKMKQENIAFSVALLDIDDFKSVNDRFGHVYGDEVLQTFADSMKCHVDGYGIAARFGGEEFMLVINSVDKDKINEIMSKIKADLESYSKETKDVCITFSGGVEEYRNDGDKITTLFNAADEKLYTAKKTGKNKIVFK